MPVQRDSSSERSEGVKNLCGGTPGCWEEDAQIPESVGPDEI